MIVRKKRSKETTSNGKPLYIIETPIKDYNGTKFQIKFYKGVGKTEHRWKAQALSEQFGYSVIIPRGEEPWVERPDTYQPERLDDAEDEGGYEDFDEDDEELEDYENEEDDEDGTEDD